MGAVAGQVLADRDLHPTQPGKGDAEPERGRATAEEADAERDDPGEDRQLGKRKRAPRRRGPVVAGCRLHKGQPEEIFTRHQPISIPEQPETGARVPMAATRLADVGPRDPQPLEVGRFGEHVVEQLAVGGLELGPSARARGPRRSAPPAVAHLLELAEPEGPRLRPRRPRRASRSRAAGRPRRRAARAGVRGGRSGAAARLAQVARPRRRVSGNGVPLTSRSDIPTRV